MGYVFLFQNDIQKWENYPCLYYITIEIVNYLSYIYIRIFFLIIVYKHPVLKLRHHYGIWLMLMNILTKRFKQGIKGNKRPKAWGILFGVIIQLTETNQIYYIKKTNNSAWYQLISNTRVIIRFQKVLKCHCLHSMSKKIFFLWVLSPAF